MQRSGLACPRTRRRERGVESRDFRMRSEREPRAITLICYDLMYRRCESARRPRCAAAGERYLRERGATPVCAEIAAEHV